MSPEQEDLGHELADALHDLERARWAPDDLAYDGWSAWPMRRELTPRERDVLTRIIEGWWHQLVAVDARIANPDDPDWWRASPIGAQVNVTGEHLNQPEFSWMRMDVNECRMLLDLARVITPRQH